jgi:hypothetical protein
LDRRAADRGADLRHQEAAQYRRRPRRRSQEFKKGLADGEDTPKLEADKKTAESATQSERDKSA